MSATVLTNSTVLFGTAWTGTAPGTASTPSGTIDTGSGTYLDATSYIRQATVDFSAALQDGTTMGSGGYATNYAGLKSGTFGFVFLGDYAANAVMDKLNTVGLGGTLYIDVKPTSSARGTSNPSYVGAVILSELQFLTVQVGNLSLPSVTWQTTGAFKTLTS